MIVRHGLGHQIGQSLTPKIGVGRQRRPLPFDKQLVRSVETRRHTHLAVFKHQTGTVALHQGRQDLLDGQLAGLIHDHVEGLAIKITKGLVSAKGFRIKLLVKDEIDISAVGNYLGHIHLLI